jgi:hypothetical protein
MILAKMAKIHDNPKKPITVYRIEDNQGQGPYQGEIRPKGYWPSKAYKLGRVKTIPDVARPGPTDDFVDSDRHESAFNESGNGKPLFGYRRPQDAIAWWGKKGLDYLASHGYHLRAVPASKAWLSSSKRQIMFHKHPTYKGNGPKVDYAGLRKPKLGIPYNNYTPDDPAFGSPEEDKLYQKEELDPNVTPPKGSDLSKDTVHGGLAEQYGMQEDDFDPAQVAVGERHETEHTKDSKTARQIAMDHLTEDPKYYSKLEKRSLIPLKLPMGAEKQTGATSDRNRAGRIKTDNADGNPVERQARSGKRGEGLVEAGKKGVIGPISVRNTVPPTDYPDKTDPKD